MTKTSATSSGGVGVCGVVGIVFIILKLVGVINWSWWWVTAPIWIPIAIILIIVAIYEIIGIVREHKIKRWKY